MKDQNWFAVALDFFIVVAGILIAFQITNWNEARANQTRTQEYLVRLQSDFEQIHQRLTNNVEGFDESLDAITQTRAILENSDKLSERKSLEFLLLLENIDAQSFPAWRSETYIEMQSAGVLGLIQKAELKRSLIQYDQTTAISQGGFEVLFSSSNYVNPILTSLIEYGPNIKSTSGTDAINVISFDFERMKREPEFNAVLSQLARSQSNNRILQANQLRDTEEVLKALSEELE